MEAVADTQEPLQQALSLAHELISVFNSTKPAWPAYIDAVTGQPSTESVLTGELGDYVPPLVWTGDAAGDSTLLETATALARQVSSAPLGGRRFHSYDFSTLADLPVGLTALWWVTRDAQVAVQLDQWHTWIVSRLTPEGALPRWHMATGVRTWSVPLTQPNYAGNVAEELLVWAEGSQDTKARSTALRMLEYWCNHPWFLQHGMWPIWSQLDQRRPLSQLVLRGLRGRWRKRGVDPRETTELAKFNTNLVAALTEAAVQTGETRWSSAVDRWLQMTRDQLRHDEGWFFGRWSSDGQRDDCSLTQNIPWLNACVDASARLGWEHWLGEAERSAQYWLDHQSSLGLFPESPMAASDHGRRAILDSQTDLSVVLFKLGSLSGDDRYCQAAPRCIDAVWKYFKAPVGLYATVGSESGTPRSVRVHTKFLTLFLKGWLMGSAIRDGRNPFTDRQLFLLSRDR